jgi:hypothetical protein
MDQQKRAELLKEIRQDILAAEQGLAELRRIEAYVSGKVNVNDVVASSSTPTPSETAQATAPTVTPSMATKTTSNPSAPPQTRAAVAGLSQAAALEIVLREIGHPMKTMDLLDAMVERGFQAPSDKRKRQSLANSLFSVMRRKSHRFRKIGKGSWGLAEWGEYRQEAM